MTHDNDQPDPRPIEADVADLVHRYGYAEVLAEVQMHAPEGE